MDPAQFLKAAGDRRPTKTVYLSPDPDRLSAAQVAAAAKNSGSLADNVDQARQDALESSWRYVVTTIPSSQWEALKSAHPPTEEQRLAAKLEGAVLAWNVETFPVAAIAACMREAVNPDGHVLTFDPPVWNADREVEVDPQAVKLVQMTWDTFPLGDTTILWNAVLLLNGTQGPSGQVQSFARGSTRTRSGER